jgi:hypothetical protein
MSRAKQLIKIINRSHRMDGWAKPPVYTTFKPSSKYEDINVIRGLVGQYFGLSNKTFAYPPFQDNDISFPNYDSIKDDVEITNYVYPTHGSKEGDYIPCLWLIRFMKEGKYQMNVTSQDGWDHISPIMKTERIEFDINNL